MAGRRPKMTAEFVREIRLARDTAVREGRRPRMKRFWVGKFSSSAVWAAARGDTYRWVQ